MIASVAALPRDPSTGEPVQWPTRDGPVTYHSVLAQAIPSPVPVDEYGPVDGYGRADCTAELAAAMVKNGTAKNGVANWPVAVLGSQVPHEAVDLGPRRRLVAAHLPRIHDRRVAEAKLSAAESTWWERFAGV